MPDAPAADAAFVTHCTCPITSYEDAREGEISDSCQVHNNAAQQPVEQHQPADPDWNCGCGWQPVSCSIYERGRREDEFYSHRAVARRAAADADARLDPAVADNAAQRATERPNAFHHCPRIMSTGRHGCWAECRCGWLSPTMTTRTGASHEWALHIRRTRYNAEQPSVSS